MPRLKENTVFRFAFALFLFNMVLPLVSCQRTSSVKLENAGRVTSTPQTQQLLAVDFSEVIENLSYVQRNESPEVAGQIGLRAAHAPGINNSEDERILGGRRLSNGSLVSTQAVLLPLCRFIGKHGKLPNNGVELFEELTTQAGYVEFMAMTAQERFERYFGGINLYTGKFYQSFDQDPPFDLGGVLIEPAQGSGTEWRGPDGPIGAADDNGQPMEFSGMFKITYFGHIRDLILYEDYCGYNSSCK
jgi:hypothetical protein